MARSLAETLTDAAREAVETSEWERDQGGHRQAEEERRDDGDRRGHPGRDQHQPVGVDGVQPRADGGPIRRAVADGETDAEEGVSEEPRADPPETAE